MFIQSRFKSKLIRNEQLKVTLQNKTKNPLPNSTINFAQRINLFIIYHPQSGRQGQTVTTYEVWMDNKLVKIVPSIHP